MGKNKILKLGLFLLYFKKLYQVTPLTKTNKQKKTNYRQDTESKQKF